METITVELESEKVQHSAIEVDGEVRQLRPDEIVMRNIEARKALEAGRC